MWLFKTRNRIENTIRFLDAWKKTNAKSKVYVRLDDDDPALSDYKILNWPENFEIVIDVRVMLSKAANEMFQTYPNEPFYGLLADDLVPKTMHWDTILSDEAVKNKIVAFDEQLLEIHHKQFEHMCIGGDLIRTAGWFGLPVVEHYYIDKLWRDVVCELPNLFVYRDDVVVEHLHPRHNKPVTYDQTYNDSISLRKQDAKAYDSWMRNEFKSFVEKLSV